MFICRCDGKTRMTLLTSSPEVIYYCRKCGSIRKNNEWTFPRLSVWQGIYYDHRHECPSCGTLNTYIDYKQDIETYFIYKYDFKCKNCDTDYSYIKSGDDKGAIFINNRKRQSVLEY
jgi:hypothetical protein